MSNTPAPDADDDFNPNKEIRRVSDTLAQPDKFAAVFMRAAENSKPMDAAIGKIVKNLLATDAETRGNLKDLIREVEKEDWRYWLKKFGIALWTAIVFFLGIVAKHFF